MHEATLAANLLQIAAETAGNRVGDVRTVVVTVGELAGLMPDAFSFAFDAMKGGAGLAKAALRMEKTPVSARCTDCGSVYAPHGFPFLCPVCGSKLFQIIGGEEVYIKELEIEE